MVRDVKLEGAALKSSEFLVSDEENCPSVVVL
jgi:hypothetical protein